MEPGCGTGNYSLGFLREGTGKNVIIDACHSMLSKVKIKVTLYNDKFEIKQATLPIIPYDHDSFDPTAFTQVLQHLDVREDTNEGTYPRLQKALCEAHRVLKPNGVILIDTTFPEVIFGNLAETLVPKTCCIVKKRFISIDNLIQNLALEIFNML